MKVRRLVAVLLAVAVIAPACGRSDSAGTAGPATSSGGTSTSNLAAGCDTEALQATDVGVTADTITIEVMADTGSPLAPGLFQGNVDAINAYAAHLNATGGVGCRELVVRTWDSKLSAAESKNGIIDSCANAVAMVGSNALFNPDPGAYSSCPDKSGAATGLPDIAALAADVHQQCNPTTYLIQAVFEQCPITEGQVRPVQTNIGPQLYFKKEFPGLHGLFLVPGDLPTGPQIASAQIKAQEGAGITWDAAAKVGGRDEQSAYTPRIQLIKENKSNYVYDGSNDVAMIKIRKEAKAQGADTVKVWSCSLACYTRNLLSAGDTDVEGTYVWMQFLPFEESGSNKELQAFVDAVGPTKVDSWGAQAWQAGIAFKAVVDRIVEVDGPNGITRKAILAGLNDFGEFDANGWMGKKSLRGTSPCFLIMQVKDGKFVRVYPAQKGSMDCKPTNLVTVSLDPAVEGAKIK